MVAISWQENKEKTIKIYRRRTELNFSNTFVWCKLAPRTRLPKLSGRTSVFGNFDVWLEALGFFPTFPETTSEKKCASTFFLLFHHQIHIFCLTKSIWPLVSNPDAPPELFFSWTPPPQPVTSSLCYQGSGVRHLYLNSGCLYWIMLWLFQSLFNHRRRLERCGISPVRSRWVGECNSTKFLSRSFHRPIYF